MKKLLSVLLVIAMLLSSSLMVFAANEPTPQEMERIIKIVKPKLDIPEEATEFSWNFYAGNVYSDASWHFTWRDKDFKTHYNASCDENGRITSFSCYNNANENNGKILPTGTRTDFEEKAVSYIKQLIPEAADSLKLVKSYSNGIYSKSYSYKFTRYENDYPLSDDNVTVTLSYVTGALKNLYSSYNYDIQVSAPGALIGDEKAKELLSTKQHMKLTYITKRDSTDEKTTVKAVLVYVPQEGYSAVDAQTGEIYDTRSEWVVRGGANEALKEEAENGKYMMSFDSAGSMADAAEEDSYRLSDEENAQLSVLEKLISKEDAIKAVTMNKYLLFPEELTAVDANLNKNYQTEKSYYQDDRGSYTWNINFSNPALDDALVNSFRRYSYSDATVNADNGKLVSYSTNLASYWDYEEAKEKAPEVKLTEEEAKEIAEAFLKEFCKDKFDNSQFTSSYPTNVIAYKDMENFSEPVYGAYCFRYERVNEGLPYTGNYINIGVDGVTGKVYDYGYRWNTNIEFQSPNGVITPEKALEYYIGLGIKTVYETNVTYIYKPANEKSKQEIMKAFILSLMATAENENGNVEAVIKKYAEDIDKERLMAILNAGDEQELMKFVGEYYGVATDDALVKDMTSEYSDLQDFYSKEENTRLVYTVMADDIVYIDPFDGKGLDYSGEVPEESDKGYTYTDISCHWAEEAIKLLGEIGIGFKGGKFEPDKKISGKEFSELANKIGFYVWNDEKEISKIKNSDEETLRIDAVKYILTCIDYDKVAILKNIFKTDFLDNADIKKEDVGYVAIANALGIVQGDGEIMRTYDSLTRAEAITIIVKAAEAVK